MLQYRHATSAAVSSLQVRRYSGYTTDL